MLAAGVAVLELRPRNFRSTETAPAGTAVMPEGVAIGGPFHLIDDKDRSVTDADYRG
jgi:hypothetical protein